MRARLKNQYETFFPPAPRPGARDLLHALIDLIDLDFVYRDGGGRLVADVDAQLLEFLMAWESDEDNELIDEAAA